MREILFRGKIDARQWIYGSLLTEYIPEYNANIMRICEDGSDTSQYVFRCFSLINKNTVGQFTGLTDRNGTKVFEGDIIKYNEDGHIYVGGVVVFEDAQFFAKDSTGNHYRLCDLCDCSTIEIIGNIHDNPELINN